MRGRKKLGNFNNKATSKKNVNKKCKRTVRTKLQKRNGRESQTQCYFRLCAHDKEHGSTSSTFPHRRREKGGGKHERHRETSNVLRTMQKTVRNNSINIPQQSLFFLSSFPLPSTGEEYSASVTVLSRGASGWGRLCSCLPSAVSKVRAVVCRRRRV